MSQQCPIILRQVDATIIRINTLLVTASFVAYLFTHQAVILMFLILDIALRLYGYKHYSPIQHVSSLVQKLLSLPVRMEDAGAKRLAAFFSLGFMIALLLSHATNLETLGHIIAGIYLICAIPYLFFGYCVGCQIYYLVKKIYPNAFA